MEISALFRFLTWLRRAESLGARGERLAARHLRAMGYRIIERNLVVGKDEADLVAIDPDARTMVIVEVKTRRVDLTAPEAAVHADKRRFLIRLAQKLRQRRDLHDLAVRFDVVAVIVPDSGQATIRHITSAFQVGE